MSEHLFDQMTPAERYEYLHDLRPDDFMDDNRPVHLPTPGQIAHCNYENLPAAYQLAVDNDRD